MPSRPFLLRNPLPTSKRLGPRGLGRYYAPHGPPPAVTPTPEPREMTRMLSVGAPNAKVKRMYRAVLEAQLAAIDAVRPGVTTVRVDAAARRVLAGYGLDQVFIHSTGHGLGLEIHEPPRLGKRDRHHLRPGMAITIEPGAYIEGFGGVRIEDTVVVTETGCEVLTPTPKELHIV